MAESLAVAVFKPSRFRAVMRGKIREKGIGDNVFSDFHHVIDKNYILLHRQVPKSV